MSEVLPRISDIESNAYDGYIHLKFWIPFHPSTLAEAVINLLGFVVPVQQSGHTFKLACMKSNCKSNTVLKCCVIECKSLILNI